MFSLSMSLGKYLDLNNSIKTVITFDHHVLDYINNQNI